MPKVQTYSADVAPGPVNGEHWHDVAVSYITDMMSQDMELNYVLFAVVPDPMMQIRMELAKNVKNLQFMQSRNGGAFPGSMNGHSDTSTTFDQRFGDVLLGANPAYNLSQDDIDAAEVDERLRARVDSNQDVSKMATILCDVALEQAHLRSSITAEQESRKEDETKAMGFRSDFTALIQRWLTMLAENGVLQGLLEESG